MQSAILPPLTAKMVLIDLDGTLVDSVPDLSRSVDQMMAALNLPLAGEQKVRDWVGNGVERLVKRALTGQMNAEPDEALYIKALPLFMAYYHENNGKLSRLYDGVVEGLRYLKQAGLHVACVTNKAAAFTLPLLKTLGIHAEFELIISGDSLAKKKPDPMPLLHAAEYFKVSPAEAVMVGDSINDVQAARSAGFKVICVTYGYNHGLDIRDAQPDRVVDSLAELPRVLKQA